VRSDPIRRHSQTGWAEEEAGHITLDVKERRACAMVPEYVRRCISGHGSLVLLLAFHPARDMSSGSQSGTAATTTGYCGMVIIDLTDVRT
jgi:hypothetical protein